jgi:type IV secretory pathway TrbD component
VVCSGVRGFGLLRWSGVRGFGLLRWLLAVAMPRMGCTLSKRIGAAVGEC